MQFASAFSSPPGLPWHWPEVSKSIDTKLLYAEEIAMRDLFFILLTLAIFAIFALIARGAEKL